MKEEKINSTLTWTKYIFSTIVFCSLFFLCSCDLGLSWGSGGDCCPYTFELGPATAHADSVVFSEDDSITMYGHFTTWNTITKIQIIEYGIVVYKDSKVLKKIPLMRNAEWVFPNDSSSVAVKATIANIQQNAMFHFAAYFIYKNGDGVEVIYESSLILIKLFEPAFIALPDSVTFSGEDKAIMWGHLETKEDCEIMSVKTFWGLLHYPINSKSIGVPQFMKANEIIQVRDTLQVASNQIYEWHIEAVAKFANDSLGYTSIYTLDFIKKN